MKYEILRGSRAFWVNDEAGCLGRFGKMGVDVHRSMLEMADGGNECLCCTHGPVDLSHWQMFKDAMLEHHKVNLNDEAPPEWLAKTYKFG